MEYCKHKKYAKYTKEIGTWEEGYKKYLENDDAWMHDFTSEYSQKDCEQSVLSQLVFLKLFRKLNNTYEIGMVNDGISISIEKHQIKKEFLFDVMNNPNTGQPFNQANAERDKQVEISFSDIYHTIGNFTPVPRTIVSRCYGPNLQLIHKDLNELWPWFIKFLRDNWKEFPTKIGELMTFEEYMTYTCQQMYFERVFNELYELFNKEIEWDSIVSILPKRIIKEEDTLISFNTLFEEKNIQEIDKQIKFLIELRGRYIIYLLKE